MQEYTPEEPLEISHRIGVTKEVNKILRELKKKHKMSKAKLTCNIIINYYKKQNEN